MRDLLKRFMARAPWPVALGLLSVVGYLILVDDQARHTLLMSLVGVSEEMDWAQAALISVLAWIGNQVHHRLDALTREVKGLHTTITEFDRDLREDIQSTKDHASGQYHSLAERVTVVEERLDTHEENRAATCPFHSNGRLP